MKNKKIALTVLLVILIQTLLNLLIPIGVFAEDMVTIQCKDQTFYSKLVEALGDKVSSKNDTAMTIIMTQANLNSVVELEIIGNTTGEQMTDITGIENFKNLTKLAIGGQRNQNYSGKYSKISDISLLGNMTNLTNLWLNGNQINDISVLKKLTNLTFLTLRKNQINDISALQNLENLTYICLNDNQIDSIDSLSNLKNLKQLFIGGNNISNINPLEGCTSLERLSVEGNKVSDISVLNKLTNLQHLRLSSNGSGNSTYGPLSSGTNPIEEKEIIEILGQSENLKNHLVELVLENVKISNINWVGNLEKLQWLELGSNNISDISAIKNLTDLWLLRIEKNQIGDISPLKNLEKLSWLSLDNNEITKTVTNKEKEVDLPQIIKAAKDSNSKIYTEKDYTLTNCTLSNDRTKIILDDNVKVASIKINEGKATGTTFTVNVAENDIPDNKNEEANNVKPNEDNNISNENSGDIQITRETNNTSNNVIEQTKDNTVATGILPQTGLGKTILTIIATIAILGVIGFIKTKKYKEV